MMQLDATESRLYHNGMLQLDCNKHKNIVFQTHGYLYVSQFGNVLDHRWFTVFVSNTQNTSW